MLVPWKQSYDQPRQHIKKQRHHFADKGACNQSYVFSRSHVWVWELDHKESWALKNWCFWTVVLEETLESPLDFKMIKPVSPKENQSWILIGRTDAEAEVQDFGHLMWRIGKTLMLGKIEGRRRRGLSEDEMVEWHHQLNVHEFEQAPGVGDGQEAWYAAVPVVSKSQTWLSNWTELNWKHSYYHIFPTYNPVV